MVDHTVVTSSVFTLLLPDYTVWYKRQKGANKLPATFRVCVMVGCVVSVHLSVPSIDYSSNMQWVCCWVPLRQEMSIDSRRQCSVESWAQTWLQCVMDICVRWRENIWFVRSSCVKRLRKRRKNCSRECRICRNSFMPHRKLWFVQPNCHVFYRIIINAIHIQNYDGSFN